MGIVSTAESSNPFHLSPQLWQLVFFVPKHACEMAEAIFEQEALAISSFEQEHMEGKPWKVEILLGERMDESEVRRRLCIMADVKGTDLPEITLHPMEAINWVEEVQKSFPPLTAGRFYVYGTHITEAPPQHLTPLLVNAGAAFGSGEHATTYGCLLALHQLAKRRTFSTVLDMGCGSGILAIAAAKTFNADVLAVDIDRVSVAVAEENIHINKVQHAVRAHHGNGYASDMVQCHAPYDLILANILARPLVAFARYLAASLAEDGVAVLSGLLAHQERKVLSAHALHGLHLKERICRDGWNTLVIGR